MSAFTDRRAYHQPAPPFVGYSHGLRFDVHADWSFRGSLDAPEFSPAGSMLFLGGDGCGPEWSAPTVICRDLRQ